MEAENKEIVIMNLSDEIIDLVNRWEDYTTSDMQGIAMAIIMRAISYGESLSAKERRKTR